MYNTENKNKYLKILTHWVVPFAVWFSWESAIRIYLDHRDWSAPRTLEYTAGNLIYGLAWSFLLATIHFLVNRASARMKRGFALNVDHLLYTLPLCALLAVPLLFYYRNYMSTTLTSMLFRWLTASGILIGLLLLCSLLIKRPAGWLATKRRLLSRTSVVLLVAPWILALAWSAPSSPSLQRPSDAAPNILLISIDTLRPDFLGIYGNRQVSTKVIDNIAREGAMVHLAFSSVAYTGPSHSTMFTGQSPLRHGVLFNGQPLPSEAVTVAEKLRNAGYRTAAFVSGYTLKTLNSGLNQGFQVYDERLSYLDFFNETFYGRIVDALPFLSLGVFRPAPEVTDAAVRWLEQSYDAPFFLFVHYFDLHYPYGKKESSRFRRASFNITAKPEDLPEQKLLYAQEIERVDLQIGRIIRSLKDRNVYDRTLVIITSDHGESLGEHGYFYGHGYYLYDPIIRIPMILRYPGAVPAGTVVNGPAALLDVHRTILGAAQTTPHPEADGINLLEMMRNPEQYADRAIFSHNFYSGIHSVRTRDWKLITGTQGSDELFHVLSDPGELNNLRDKEKRQLAEMRNLLRQALLPGVSTGSGWKPEDLTPEQRERLKSLGYVQ